jgi:hypothetical protein
MQSGHNPLLRFGIALQQTISPQYQPSLPDGPALPVVNYQLLGKSAPILPPMPATLPKADTVVITWADAE